MSEATWRVHWIHRRPRFPRLIVRWIPDRKTKIGRLHKVVEAELAPPAKGDSRYAEPQVDQMARPTNSDRPCLPPDAASCSAPAVGEPARYRVLLVEDYADLAEATAELMRLHGLEVSIASSGRHALSLAEELNPVLVLCDLRLPDMTGLDVAQALRARPGAKDILIVIFSAMTAGDLRDFEVQARANGVNLFLPKPLTSDLLIDLLSRLDALQPAVGPKRLA